MICKNCGTELNISAKYCSKCGAIIGEAATSFNSSSATMSTAPSAQQHGRKSFKWFLAIGLVIVVLLLLFDGRSAEKTAEQFMTSILDGKASKCVSLLADDLVDMAAAGTKKVLVHQMEGELRNVIDNYKDEYGSNWDFAVKIIDSYDVDLGEAIHEKVKDVIVSIEHKGHGFLWSTKEGEDTYCVTVIKDGRKWYVLNWYRT